MRRKRQIVIREKRGNADREREKVRGARTEREAGVDR